MNRNSARNFSLYMGIFLIIAMLYNVMQEMDRAEGPDYSQIRTYFMQEQVDYFTLRDNTLTLELKPAQGEEKGKTLRYQLADPSVFYLDVSDLVNKQLASGVLSGYDYPAGVEDSPWYNMIPYLAAMALVALFFFIVYRQRMGGGGGGGAPGASKFGQARTHTLSEQD